jgi:hypothetical protein
VAISIFQRYVGAKVTGNSRLTAEKGTILIDAQGEDFFVNVILAAGASSNAAVTGSVPVIVSSSNVEAIVRGNYGDSDYAILTAGDSIGILANLSGQSYLAAGAVAGSSTAAIGATIDTAVYKNVVTVSVDNAVVTAHCNYHSPVAIKLPNRENRRRGVVVSATSDNTIMTFAVCGAISGNAAVNGVVNTLVVENCVKALVGRNDDQSDNDGEDGEGSSESYVSVTTGGEILVNAEDDSDLVDAAGALAIGSSVGAGATVVTLVYNKTVHAKLNARYAEAADAVSVLADSNDDVFLLAISFGGSSSGLNLRCFGLDGLLLAAASKQAQNHCNSQQQCKSLFHFISSLKIYLLMDLLTFV